ncbi:class II aldolase/adducin family protein [Salinispora vitiensis]|uniref:class II aldolase/adducin family protein n=1 Tax=Salinispora vitiensis TaxID=999544 RepID=UPI00037CDCD0|nr:class II aldolase/adducin family protein [Salinispora vitiensis]
MSPRREELSIDDLKPIPDEVLVANYSPEMPSGYEDPAEERRYRKERLVGALRLFAEYGFDEGVAGHISARDPEFPHLFWVNPFLIPFAHVKVSDLSLMDEDGNVLKGKYPIARAAFVIHACIHKHRPDVVGAAHAHSIYGKALSATDQFIEPLTQDAAVFYHDQASFDDYTGVVVDLDEGNRLATTLGDKKAIILGYRQHTEPSSGPALAATPAARREGQPPPVGVGRRRTGVLAPPTGAGRGPRMEE